MLPTRRVVARPRDGYHWLSNRVRYSIAHDTVVRSASRDGQQDRLDGRQAKPLRRTGDGDNGCALLAAVWQRRGDAPDAGRSSSSAMLAPCSSSPNTVSWARQRAPGIGTKRRGCDPFPGRREDVLVVVAHPEQHRLPKSLDKLIGEGAEPFEDAELSGCRSP